MIHLRDIPLGPDALRHILRDTRLVTNGKWDEIAKDIVLTPKSLERFMQGTRKELTHSETIRICNYIERVTDRSQKIYLRARYPQYLTGVFPADADPSLAIASWLQLSDQGTSEFARYCQERLGRYLLMRRTGTGALVCAVMFVQPPSRRRPTAMFRTYRPTSNGEKKLARGFLYELHGRILTYGHSLHPRGVRTAHLIPKPIAGRLDLRGLRLGLSVAEKDPYAHRIYCYQLQRRDDPLWPAVRDVLGKTDEDGFDRFGRFMSKTDLDRILDFLTVKGLDDNGLIAH